MSPDLWGSSSGKGYELLSPSVDRHTCTHMDTHQVRVQKKSIQFKRMGPAAPTEIHSLTHTHTHTCMHYVHCTQYVPYPMSPGGCSLKDVSAAVGGAKYSCLGSLPDTPAHMDTKQVK